MCEEHQISVEPLIIDFGCLQPGMGSKATIRVEGRPAKATINSKRIQIKPIEINEESTNIEVIIDAGSAGDLLWDRLHIQTDKGEIEIPIICWWDDILSQSLKESIPMIHAVAEETLLEPTMTEQQESAVSYDDISNTGDTESANSLMTEGHIPASTSERIYVARSCPWCGRNFRYDSDKKLWLKCEKCVGARRVVSLLLRVINEIKLGVQDGKKTIRDIWEVITGKQDWTLR